MMALGLRLLRRETRQRELWIMVVALMIAVTALTSVNLFAHRLQQGLNQAAGEFLAGDLVFTDSHPLPEALQQQATAAGLTASRTLEFSSVLMENEQLLLAGIKAVSQAYPLRGHLTLHTDRLGRQDLRHGPPPGQAWVDDRVLSALKLNIGAQLLVGEVPLTISGVLVHEPDRRGNLFSLTPRVMMNLNDIDQAGVLRPGSHVHYFYQWAGPEQAVAAFKKALTPQLQAGQKLLDIRLDRPELGAVLSRTEQTLGLASVLVVLLSGVAMAASARQFTLRQYDATAVLRCLGMTRACVLKLYAWQWLVLGGLLSTLGVLLGWLGYHLLLALFADLIPAATTAPGPWVFMQNWLLGVLGLFAFAWPPLQRLGQVSPLRVLRHDLDAMPASAWLTYTLALVLVVGLLLAQRQPLSLVLGFALFGPVVSLALLSLLTWLIAQSRRGAHWGAAALRFALISLSQNAAANSRQVLVLALTLFVILTSYVARNDLLADWQQQLPANAPNYFLLNVFPDYLPELKAEFNTQAIAASRFYPVVRGRLVTINEHPATQQARPGSQGERALHRDLSLTFARDLPETNQIIEGTWWAAKAPSGQVSVEQGVADSLGLKVGDRLAFSIGGRQVNAIISSIRRLRWDSLKPNFYFIFTPGTLDDFAATYLTSFYLPDSQKHLLNAWARAYPGASILEIGALVRQLQKLIGILSQALNYLAALALGAGVLVLLAQIGISLKQRQRQGALLRTLGGSRSWLMRVYGYEFLLLGAMAGLLAVLLTELTRWLVYDRLLHLDYGIAFGLDSITLVLSTLLIGALGFFGVRPIYTRPPILLLRETA
ncbi:MAG: FtsX-like permease family protein [Methylococcales bacterium]|nr:FtsX-like permease family protein [Methylococcales bacterium]